MQMQSYNVGKEPFFKKDMEEESLSPSMCTYVHVYLLVT